jgi:cytochrome c peroxidase
MKTQNITKAVALATAFVGLWSCAPETNGPINEPFGLVVPDHFPDPVYNNPENPITREGFELGRRLFYDPILSRDNSISCGTCHAQVHAFADHNFKVSTGIDGLKGTRNAPSVVNAAWQTHFMWDGGINHLEIMPFGPINNPVEMDQDLGLLMEELRNDPHYPERFRKAFGTTEINSQRFFYALAQFQAMLVSSNSKYDHFLQGKAAFSPAESRGLTLFRTHCASCHQEPLLTDQSFANNGLDLYSLDGGRATITLQPQDSGLFKVPSLRNVALTHPYMHDGRFWSLAEVIEHYSTGVQQHPQLDERLGGNKQFTEGEKADLLAFLQTLTDPTFLSDPRLGEPKLNEP